MTTQTKEAQALSCRCVVTLSEAAGQALEASGRSAALSPYPPAGEHAFDVLVNDAAARVTRLSAAGTTAWTFVRHGDTRAASAWEPRQPCRIRVRGARDGPDPDSSRLGFARGYRNGRRACDRAGPHGGCGIRHDPHRLQVLQEHQAQAFRPLSVPHPVRRAFVSRRLRIAGRRRPAGRTPAGRSRAWRRCGLFENHRRRALLPRSRRRHRRHGAGQGGYVLPYGNKPLPFVDGFFGGPQLVRGFAPNGFGPRDLTTYTTQDNIGGGQFAASTAELQSPIPGLP